MGRLLLNESFTCGVSSSQEEPVLPKVPFAACMERWAGDEVMDDYYSAALGGRTRGIKRTRFASFSPYLFISLKRLALLLLFMPPTMCHFLKVLSMVMRMLRSPGVGFGLPFMVCWCARLINTYGLLEGTLLDPDGAGRHSMCTLFRHGWGCPTGPLILCGSYGPVKVCKCNHVLYVLQCQHKVAVKEGWMRHHLRGQEKVYRFLHVWLCEVFCLSWVT
jgi:hypothetical protein